MLRRSRRDGRVEAPPTHQVAMSDILRTRSPVTFVYVEGDKRLEVPRHARRVTLVYYVLDNLGLTDRIEQIASAFWALRDRGHIDTIEISYRAGSSTNRRPPPTPFDVERLAARAFLFRSRAFISFGWP